MTENKRFTLAYEKGNWWAVKDGDITLWKEETIALLNSLNDENEQLKKENNNLHQKIFEMRTNVALDRTEISRQSYTSKEFLDELEKW